MGYVLNNTKIPLSREQLISDTLLLIVAGAETTFSALVQAVYHLAKNPQIQQDLQHEISIAIPSEAGTLAYEHLANCQLLEGVVNETLRLHPPVSTMLPRETPPEGLWIDDVFVPGDTLVVVPTWTMQRGSYISPKSSSRLFAVLLCLTCPALPLPQPPTRPLFSPPRYQHRRSKLPRTGHVPPATLVRQRRS